VPAAPPAAPAREPTFNVPARIFGVTAAHAVSAGRPVGATDAFTPDDGPICVWFQHEGCPAGTIVKSDWYFLGVDRPMHIGDATTTVGSVGNWGQFNLELAPGKRWPGSLFRRRSITTLNSAGTCTGSGGGSWLRIAEPSSKPVRPWKGRWPDTIP
jgi:hypothetical protein